MTTQKRAKHLAKQPKEAKEPVACPYCTDGRIEYDIVNDTFTCEGCGKEISAIEYEKIVSTDSGA